MKKESTEKMSVPVDASKLKSEVGVIDVSDIVIASPDAISLSVAETVKTVVPGGV